MDSRVCDMLVRWAIVLVAVYYTSKCRSYVFIFSGAKPTKQCEKIMNCPGKQLIKNENIIGIHKAQHDWLIKVYYVCKV